MDLAGRQYFLIVRLLSLWIVFVLYFLLPRPLYVDVYFAVLFSHYSWAFVKARHRAADVLASPRTYPAVLFLGGISTLYIFTGWPNVFVLFGFHHAANDVYMRFNLGREGRDRAGREAKFYLFILNLAAYFIIIRHDPSMTWLPLPLLLGGVILGIGGAVFEFWRTRHAYGWGRLSELLLFEFINLAMVTVSFVFYLPVMGLDFVFYHLVLWMFLPFWRYQEGRHFFNVKSLVHNLALATPFFLLTPTIGIIPNLPGSVLEVHANIWGFIHVSFTFAVSNLNPEFVRAVFRPEPWGPWRRWFLKTSG